MHLKYGCGGFCRNDIILLNGVFSILKNILISLRT